MSKRFVRPIITAAIVLLAPAQVAAQIDSALAQRFFGEARAFCEADGGRMWGVSLCGPMVFADARTGLIATNQAPPPPEVQRPRALGYANAAMAWGETRWSTFVWPAIPRDDAERRGRLLVHELFHRVQPDLGLFIASAPGLPDHLDTPDGRYWMQLEWRALSRALERAGDAPRQAIGDALSFRQQRRRLAPASAEIERINEINEGLAQFTATVVVAGSSQAAHTDAIEQLQAAPDQESFVRTFAYPSGAAYGILLDSFAPGWTHRLTAKDDLGDLLMRASGTRPAADPDAAAERYGGTMLRAAEQQRESKRQARIASLRAAFVDGPLVRLPRGSGASFVTLGVTPLPGEGTVYRQYRVSGPWGRLEAGQVLVSADGTVLTVRGPAKVVGGVATGDEWTLTIAEGWTLRAGARQGDFVLVQGT
ncbi:MAG: hypothetical protein WED32_02170 [Patescibacteria group bacterium]